MDLKKKSTGTLSQGTMIGYGASGYGAAMFFNNFSFYALFFFTDLVGIKPLAASAIISVGAIWDAFSSPVVGYISDHRDWRKGRRRPFLLWAAIPLALSNWLIFTDFGLSDSMTILYFGFMTIAAYTCQSLVDIPYTALGAEISQDYDERASLSACRNVFWLLSIVISSYFPGIAAYGASLSNGDQLKGYSFASLVCSIPIVITVLITYFSTKGREAVDIEIETKKYDMKKALLEPLKNRPFRFVTGVFVFSIMAQAVSNTASMYFYAHVMKLNAIQISNLLVYAALVGFIGIWLSKKVSTVFSKKVSWNVFMGMWVVSNFALFILTPTSSLFTIAIYGLLYGMGINVQYQLVWSMIPDCMEVNEFKYGDRREGMFYGVISFIQKAGGAIAIALTGVGLNFIGYDVALEVQTEGTLMGLRILLSLGATIPLLISMTLSTLNPMTREVHAELRKALELKKAGKEYSTEKLDTVL